MPTMMEGEGENGPSNCSWEVYLGAEAFCWYRYALLLWSSTPDDFIGRLYMLPPVHDRSLGSN